MKHHRMEHSIGSVIAAYLTDYERKVECVREVVDGFAFFDVINGKPTFLQESVEAYRKCYVEYPIAILSTLFQHVSHRKVKLP